MSKYYHIWDSCLPCLCQNKLTINQLFNEISYCKYYAKPMCHYTILSYTWPSLPSSDRLHTPSSWLLHVVFNSLCQVGLALFCLIFWLQTVIAWYINKNCISTLVQRTSSQWMMKEKCEWLNNQLQSLVRKIKIYANWHVPKYIIFFNTIWNLDFQWKFSF